MQQSQEKLFMFTIALVLSLNVNVRQSFAVVVLVHRIISAPVVAFGDVQRLNLVWVASKPIPHLPCSMLLVDLSKGK